MAGRAAMTGIGAVKSDISSTSGHLVNDGISGSETSAIGGMARRGNPKDLPMKDVCTMGNKGGNASTGQTGYGSGSGKEL